MQVFKVFAFFVKSGLARLSEDALPQDANSFAGGGRTASDTSVNTDALQKKMFFMFLFL